MYVVKPAKWATAYSSSVTGSILRYRTLRVLYLHYGSAPGVPLRYTPGFMLSPRSAGYVTTNQLNQRFLKP